MARSNTALVELQDYSVTHGTTYAGAAFSTFRQSGKPTLTAYGEVAKALTAARRMELPTVIETTGRGAAIKVLSAHCPATGLPIGEFGREEARPREERAVEVKTGEEPKSIWNRIVDGVRVLYGEKPTPEPILSQRKVVAPSSTGYPTIDRLVDRIRVELERSPNLMGENGARFDVLVESHLPRVAAVHAKSVRGLSPQEARPMDETLMQIVESTTKVFEDAVAYERQTMMDGMKTELSFLQARHGIVQGPTALLSSISEPTEAHRIMADAKDRDRHSEWSRPDAYAAEIPPRLGVPLVGASAGVRREQEADKAPGRRISGILSKGPSKGRETDADLAAAVLRRSAERREGR